MARSQQSGEAPSLFQAHLRHERAQQHWELIQSEITRLRSTMTTEPFRRTVEVGIGGPDPPVGPIILPDRMLSLWIGEMIYNLRAALDYTVYAIAWRDSRTPQLGTQFPIEDDPKVFKGRSTGRVGGKSYKRYLLGVSKTHVEWIKRYQPCEGCTWTRTLADISNPDKHRELLALSGRFTPINREVSEMTTDAQGRRFIDLETWIEYATLANGETLERHLAVLQQEVGNLLALFDPEF